MSLYDMSPTKVFVTNVLNCSPNPWSLVSIVALDICSKSPVLHMHDDMQTLLSAES